MSDEASPILFLLGATHHTAPIEVREKLALAGGKLAELQGALRSLAGLREFAVLNTCNRVEIYGVAAGPGTVDQIQSSFCALNQIEPSLFERIRLQLRDHSTVQHLLEVAAGVDSQMVGETEILGQVKHAYAAAQEKGTTGPVLNRVFQKSFQAAKHVRTNTAIGEGQISVASVAVDLALKIFGNLQPCHALVLGAGLIGEKTARAFKSRGTGTMTVASRRLEHAAELAGSLSARAIPFDQVADSLPDFDVAVCSTAAPEPVVTRPMVAAAMRRRSPRPLFLIDLAMPRNIAPDVAELANVFLYNLDDLAKIAEENLARRQAEIDRARALLAEKSTALWQQVAPRVGGNHATG
jgi:glutamyl-tRNA reductase